MFAVYLSVFTSTFLAATFVPVPSEVVVLAAASNEQINFLLLWLVATAGNTLGAVVNYWLGRFSSRFQKRKWWPATEVQMRRAESWFQRYGIWSLLFAWLPLVGDPLTLIAGVLRVRLLSFVLLVGLGKGLRFAAVIYLINRAVFAG